ncbi:MAG: ribonuclease III domain-containing protein [Candidatus Izemoplasma sp.]
MNQLNGTTLAYIGDAIYEVFVRDYFIKKGLTKVDDLHKSAIKYTSAVGQKAAYDLIASDLTEFEVSIFKRGRNANTDRKARNTDLATYKKATGFEALIGYLYIEGSKDRLDEIINKILK